MATKRTRKARKFIENIIDEDLFLFSDGLLGKENPFWQFRYSDLEAREIWAQCRSVILATYERQCPGRYPKAFYDYD